MYGALTLISGIGILFFDDKSKRNAFLQVLIVLQLIYAFFMHNPFFEQDIARSREFKHFMLSMMITFSLFMIMGYRTIWRWLLFFIDNLIN